MRFNEQSFSARKCRKIRKNMWDRIMAQNKSISSSIQTLQILAMPHGSLFNGITCSEHNTTFQYNFFVVCSVQMLLGDCIHDFNYWNGCYSIRVEQKQTLTLFPLPLDAQLINQWNRSMVYSPLWNETLCVPHNKCAISWLATIGAVQYGSA